MARPVDLDEIVGRGGRLARPVELGSHLVPVLGAAAQARQTCCVRLERRPRLVEQGELAHIDRRHVDAAAGEHHHELVAHEALERFANGCSTHLELLLELVLAHHGARREVEADDHPPDLVVRPFTERHAHSAIPSK